MILSNLGENWGLRLPVNFMKTLILILIPIFAYASDFEDIQAETYKRVIVRNTYYAQDYTPVKEGETRWGNCSTHAATAKALLEAKGYKARYRFCTNFKHVYTTSNGYAFDAKFKGRLVTEEQAQEACE